MGESADDDGNVRIRVKVALGRSMQETGRLVQFVEYAPGHTDPVHTRPDEFFIVTEGSLWLRRHQENGAGSIVFIPRNPTMPKGCAGDEGARHFRAVIR